MNQKLFREERLQLITELVRTRRKVHVDELAAEFKVSPSSIRIDLTELESRGLLKRTHGGAIATTKFQGRMVTQKSSLELRQAAQQTEKMAIGRAAAELIEDGDTLMIDGGSTTFHLAPFDQQARSYDYHQCRQLVAVPYDHSRWSNLCCRWSAGPPL